MNGIVICKAGVDHGFEGKSRVHFFIIFSLRCLLDTQKEKSLTGRYVCKSRFQGKIHLGVSKV